MHLKLGEGVEKKGGKVWSFDVPGGGFAEGSEKILLLFWGLRKGPRRIWQKTILPPFAFFTLIKVNFWANFYRFFRNGKGCRKLNRKKLTYDFCDWFFYQP